jgi:PadR family transcriptional regulator, regulatory protein PadR
MENRFLENWSTQVRKGLLELCILNTLRGRRLYGYDIVKILRDIDGLVIGEGTIYPILSRFRAQGLVGTSLEESPEGPPRKYYSLTRHGEKCLAEMNSSWRRIQEGLENLQRDGER